jgi:hypothetical protein
MKILKHETKKLETNLRSKLNDIEKIEFLKWNYQY